jgi:hypothetical protein
MFNVTESIGVRSILLQEALRTGRMRCLESPVPYRQPFHERVMVLLLCGLGMVVDYRRTRRPQMEARMVSADAPRGAIAARKLPAFVVELGITLVPELVTSTTSKGGVAIVAGPARKGLSRGCLARAVRVAVL